MDDVQFIIIAATGRSGSTTMQRIVSTIPDSNINGENANFIGSLLRAYKSLKKTEQMLQMSRDIKFSRKAKYFKHPSYKPCWENNFVFKEFKYNLKKIIYDFLYVKYKKILGFKEIRFLHLDLLDEFIELFPNTKIILHCEEDTHSQTHSENKANWLKPEDEEILKRRNAEMKAKQLSNPVNYYYSSFENMFNVKEMEKLFNFLGYEMDKVKYNQIINDDRG